ncbi:MAG: PAS domain S-box protein, partial [bacterium]
MDELVLKALEFIEYPLLIYNQKNSQIIFKNSKAEPFIRELEKRNILSKLKYYYGKELTLIVEEDLSRIYIGKIKKLDEEGYLIYFEELKKDRPFSGFLFDIFENLPVLVFLIKAGNIFYVNGTIEALLGYKREEVINKKFIKDLIWDYDKPKAEMYYKRISQQVKEEGNIFAIEDKYGRVKNFLWNGFLTRDWNGEEVVVCIASDISEYLELSQKIEKLHKTQTFVEFLRGLVHDFNNLLQTILDHLQKLKTSPLTKMDELLYGIEKNLYSWIDINRILLDYTREYKELRNKKIDLIEFFKENLEVFQFVLGERVKIYLDLGYFKNLFTYGDSAFWKFICLNFLVNAKDAIEGDGEIYISLSKVEDSINQRTYVKIGIKDTGRGIPEEILPKIFDPFFT